MKLLSEDVKINPTKLDSYFSFMQGAKSANSNLFKDFCNEAEMGKNSQIVGFILTSSLSIVPLLFLMMISTFAFSQRYHISTPIDGFFYFDSTAYRKPAEYNSLRYIDIVSYNNTLASSGSGKVIYCATHSDRTYEVGIKYASVVMVYSNLRKKSVLNTQFIAANAPIGELNFNPKDKKYHLGLQVWEVGAPKQMVWNSRLIQYLNGTPVADHSLLDN